MRMNPLAGIRRALLFRGCILNSLPKSGTHLLAKIVGMLPDVRSGDFFRALRGRSFPVDASSGVMIPLGVGNPQLVPREEIQRLLRGFERGTCAIGHVPFSDEMAALLQELRIKMLSIVRDPRDVVVSHAKYVVTVAGSPAQNGHAAVRLSEYYQTLSESEQLMTSIVGVWKEPTGPFLRNIRDRLDSILPWSAQPFNYTTTFERLVGPHGGGSRDVQLREIHAIVSHLGLRCPDRDLAAIADRAFGDAATFRQGLIGTWRDHCTEEHKQALKALVGQRLIDLGYEKDLAW